VKKFYLLLCLLIAGLRGFSQDLDFSIAEKYLDGKNIIKIHKDHNDPYLWALGLRNTVYRINTSDNTVEDLSSQFGSFYTDRFIDITAASKDNVFIGTSGNVVINYNNGTVNDIGRVGNGIQATVNSVEISAKDDQVLIGTDKQLFTYDIAANRLAVIVEGPVSHMYESVYRKSIYTAGVEDAVGYSALNASVRTLLSTYFPMVYQGGQFGEPITSVTFTNNVLNTSSALSLNIFWATKFALFQSQVSNTPGTPSDAYQSTDLRNINKLTDIYGYAAFGNPLAKANMIAGTDKGFYWSDSYLEAKPSGAMAKVSFPNLLTPNKNLVSDPVYDIEVAAGPLISGLLVACENKVWLASSTGVFELKSSYVNVPARIDGIHFKGMTAATEVQGLCTGPLVIQAEQPSQPAASIRWFKDGQMIAGETGNEITVTQPGEYYSEWYAACENVTIQTNRLMVRSPGPPNVQFNYQANVRTCEGTNFTFSISTAGIYGYKWYRDGLVIPGETKKDLSTSIAGTYYAEVTTCESLFTTQAVKLDVDAVPLAVMLPSKPGYCFGDEAVISLNLAVSSNYKINWYKDGLMIAGMQDKTEFRTTSSATYTVGIQVNSTGCERISTPLKISFDQRPVGVIDKSTSVTLCEGEKVTLKVNYTAGTVTWSTGETGTEIVVIKGGTYKAVLKSPGGCETELSAFLSFKPAPVFTVADVVFCPADNAPAEIHAPPGFAKYIWNGVPSSSSIYYTKNTGSVTLTVEDQSGCQATRYINVVAKCFELKPYNVFTPNGDGINDSWAIPGIENFPNPRVQVFNRNGTRVFDSKGTYSPWNGTIKGQRLPAGVYFYAIATKNGGRVVSGSVSIFY
jgi:gliding motility-associated-like protein